MNGNYTWQVCTQVLSLLDKETCSIWNTIQTQAPGDDASRWRETLGRVAKEYSLSSRFALMRILAARDGGFPVTRPISPAQAAELTVQESLDCLNRLLEMAGEDPDNDPELCEYLITRAWDDEEGANEAAAALLPRELAENPKAFHQAKAAFAKENKKKFRTRLTRPEAMMLGHCLGFSLAEMEWYLLRVFDCGDVFRFNESGDVIDAYGFLAGAGIDRVERLRSRYLQTVVSQPRQTEVITGQGWTQLISDNLPQLVSQWQHQPENMDEAFFRWIQGLSARLDQPSQTALRIYRNLAAFADDLLTGEELIPEEADLEDCIHDVYRETEESGAVRRLLYDGDTVSPVRCRELAARLLLENKIQSASQVSDNAGAWHVLTTRADGMPTASGGLNASRTRVTDILLGRVQPEKGDFLYLLWFIENLTWQNADPADRAGIRDRIIGFIQTADYLLEAALLPHFYAPHLMEQAMLLSIVQGSKMGEDSAVIYEYALNAFKERRERAPGSVRHDLESKIRIVTDYIQSPDMTLEQCAAKYCISPKTLSAWQKSLLEKGLVSGARTN